VFRFCLRRREKVKGKKGRLFFSGEFTHLNFKILYNEGQINGLVTPTPFSI